MKTRILNYRIIVTPDVRTGIDGKVGFTAFCPTLGVADDGNTIEESLKNIKEAIEMYVKSLAEDKEPIPIDQPESDFITTTQIVARSSLNFV